MPVDQNDIFEWKNDYISSGGLGENTPQDNAGNIASLWDDYVRSIKSVVAAEAASKQWVRFFANAVKHSSSEIAFDPSLGNITGLFPWGHRLYLDVQGSSPNTGYVVNATYGDRTVVRVNFDHRRQEGATYVDVNTIKIPSDQVVFNPPGSLTWFMAASTSEPGFTHRKYVRQVSTAHLDGSGDTIIVHAAVAPYFPYPIVSGDIPWVNYSPLRDTGAAPGAVVWVYMNLFTSTGASSGHPVIARSGSAVLPGTGTTGPFRVDLSSPVIDSNYTVLLQVTNGPASVGTPVERWFPYISNRGTTFFDISLADALPVGETLTLDYLILR